MRNFLDINAIAPADLRAIIDSARAIKEARAGRPKAFLTMCVPWTAAWWR